MILKTLVATSLSLVVLATGESCSGGTASGGNKTPDTTSVVGTLVVREASKSGLDGYTRWTTGWGGKPAGKLIDAHPGGSYRVAGFCVPKGYEAKGTMKNSFDWSSEVTIKGGDCRKVNHLERYDLTVKKD